MLWQYLNWKIRIFLLLRVLLIWPFLILIFNVILNNLTMLLVSKCQRIISNTHSRRNTLTWPRGQILTLASTHHIFLILKRLQVMMLSRQVHWVHMICLIHLAIIDVLAMRFMVIIFIIYLFLPVIMMNFILISIVIDVLASLTAGVLVVANDVLGLVVLI